MAVLSRPGAEVLEVRRVVAGVGEAGQSDVVRDGPPPQSVDQPGRGLTFYELWATERDGGISQGTEDAGAQRPSHHPPPGGTKFRIVELLPDHDRSGDPSAELEAFGGRSAEDESDRSFHKNDTVDYNIVLAGEMYAKTEAGEVLLKSGDVLIQRGTKHTWSNRSDRPCVYASIMVSASPVDGTS